MSDGYAAYAAQYHSVRQTPEPMLDRMVERATGSRPAVKQRLTDASNEVYLVATAAGAEYLLKVNWCQRGDSAQEHWAMERGRAAGVPVPAVLLVDVEGGREFMVQTRAPGRMLSSCLAGLSESERARSVASSRRGAGSDPFRSGRGVLETAPGRRLGFPRLDVVYERLLPRPELRASWDPPHRFH